MRTSSRYLVSLVAAAVLCLSCASWWARTPEHLKDVGKILSCVMAEYDAGTKVLDIVVKCGLQNEQEVLDLVTAQKTAEARHVKAGVGPCPSASVSPTPPTPSASASTPAPVPSSSAKPTGSSSTSASAKPAGNAK